jgi:hypothetical protein
MKIFPDNGSQKNEMLELTLSICMQDPMTILICQEYTVVSCANNMVLLDCVCKFK